MVCRVGQFVVNWSLISIPLNNSKSSNHQLPLQCPTTQYDWLSLWRSCLVQSFISNWKMYVFFVLLVKSFISDWKSYVFPYFNPSKTNYGDQISIPYCSTVFKSRFMTDGILTFNSKTKKELKWSQLIYASSFYTNSHMYEDAVPLMFIHWLWLRHSSGETRFSQTELKIVKKCI